MRSIGMRLTLFQILVTGIGVVAMLVIAQHLFVADIQAEQDSGIREIAGHLQGLELPDRISRTSLAAAVEEHKATSTFRGDFPWLFISRGDSILYSSDERAVAVSSFDSINRALLINAPVDSTLQDVTVSGELYRCYRVPIGEGLYLTVIYSWDDLSGPAARAELIVSLLLVILLTTIGLGNLFLTRKELKPVDEMISAMNSIIDEKVRPTEYGELMPVQTNTDRSADEIRSLRETFAQMLARLHETATAEYRFIAEAAHDIVDPLTVLRSDIELDAPSQRSPEEQEGFERTIRQLDEIQQLSSDLMLLAHFGLSGGRQSFVPVSMSDVILEEGADLMPRASLRRVAIVTDLSDEEVICIADPNMVRRVIRRVLGIVLANTSFGSKVSITLSSEEKYALVTVVDLAQTEYGPRPEHETASTKISSANRLVSDKETLHGIAITREVVRLQGGSIDITTSNDSGIVVVLRLPFYTPDLRLP